MTKFVITVTQLVFISMITFFCVINKCFVKITSLLYLQTKALLYLQTKVLSPEFHSCDKNFCHINMYFYSAQQIITVSLDQ